MHRNEWKLKHNNPKLMGFSKSSAMGKVHSNPGLPHETRKKSFWYLAKLIQLCKV